MVIQTVYDWCIANDRLDILSEWSNEKNGDNTPQNTFKSSNNKIWWHCSKQHEWQSSPRQRTKYNSRCPYCSNRKFLSGFNDLSITDPVLSSQWDYEKNYPLTPNDVKRGNNRKVWWLGECGHSWESAINTRALQGRGCPICAIRLKAEKLHQNRLKNGNSLAEKYPDIAKEWNNERNGALTPFDVTPGSKQKVWWRCSRFGHEWEAAVGSRTGMKSECPYCKSTYRVSFNEKALAYYLSQITTVIPSYRPKFLLGKEIDIFLPKINTGIEYDGIYSHKIMHDKSSKDREKTLLCKQNNVVLIRVREEGLPIEDDCVTYVIPPKPTKIEPTVKTIINDISKQLQCQPPDINIDRDYADILRNKELAIKENSLGELYPELIPEWNVSRNYPMNVYTIRANTNHKVWWKCEKGHEWQATVDSRTRGHGCPFCSGRKIIEGKTDLETTYPELSQEWDYEKNYPLTPRDVTPGMDRSVWWIGSCGHSWEARIFNRVRRKSGCPYCSKPPTKILVGFNDLATVNPVLAKDWNFDKNGDLTPQDVMAGSTKKVWWKCEKGHEWQAVISQRNCGRTGCPQCFSPTSRHKEPISVTHPHLIEEWDYEKNTDLSPDTITSGSEKTVWWVCNAGHSWTATPYYRCRTGNPCPICSGKKILPGFNDLKTTNPELANEWDYEKNGSLLPENVSIKMDRTVWWKCEFGHEWKAMIRNRVGSKCPYCAGSKVIPGKTDLATKYPQLISEWDEEKNNGLRPDSITYATNKSYWWKCKYGHSWKATVSNRTKGKTGCPVCSGKIKQNTSRATSTNETNE